MRRLDIEQQTALATDPYLTIKEICTELNVAHETVRKWILAGRLPHVKAGRMYRIRRSDLDRMLSGGAPEHPMRASESELAGLNAMRPGARLDSRFHDDS